MHQGVPDERSPNHLRLSRTDELPSFFERKVLTWVGFPTDGVCKGWMEDYVLQGQPKGLSWDKGDIFKDHLNIIMSKGSDPIEARERARRKKGRVNLYLPPSSRARCPPYFHFQ